MNCIKKYICLLCTAAALAVQPTANAEFISGWAAGDYEKAAEAGLLCSWIAEVDMKENITRGEFCELAMKLYDCFGTEQPEQPEKSPFTDCNDEAVVKAYNAGIVSGVSKTKFEPDRPVTREEISKILVKAAVNAEIPVMLFEEDKKYIEKFSDKDKISEWAENSVVFLVKNNIITGVEENLLMPSANTTREQAVVIVNRMYSEFCENKKSYEIPRITSASFDNGFNLKWTSLKDCSMYRVILKKDGRTVSYPIAFENSITIKNSGLTSENGVSAVIEAVMTDGRSVFSVPYEFDAPAAVSESKPQTSILPEQTPTAASVSPQSAQQSRPSPTPVPKNNTYTNPFSGINIPNSIINSEENKESKSYKENRVFNGGEPFAAEEEAKANMTDIEVDVWNIAGNGEKIAKKMTITVNKNLAEDVKSIFKEIFEGEEKFPIKSCSGYSWRKSASGRLSQHSYGTCIDINPNENYYISSSGEILSGSYWKPYEDPYSITAEGEVVRIFAKYGFDWGATAWGEGHARDYMHFTYLGN